MAQIIKQRRGSITQLKDVTARISELVVATGSIGNLNGPFLFVGETEGVAVVVMGNSMGGCVGTNVGGAVGVSVGAFVGALVMRIPL